MPRLPFSAAVCVTILLDAALSAAAIDGPAGSRAPQQQQAVSAVYWKDEPRHSQAPAADRRVPLNPGDQDIRPQDDGRDDGRRGGLRVGPDPNDSLAPYLLPEANYRAEAAATERELDTVRTDLQAASVIPEVLPAMFAPEFAVTVKFGHDLVPMGELLTTAQVQDEPSVEFDAPPNQLFAIAIVDPDAPSVSRHGYRSYRHYLLGNLGLHSFDTLTPFEPPSPSPGPAHRYVVLVFRQHAHIAFGPDDVPDSRVRFDAAKWARELNMTPVAATFFTVKGGGPANIRH
ncbi:hypothetical protein H4R19_002847 [Coemansia spiralis]|nr:hypothetical protein H4R19_002847 [Coemansia spiralis]